MSRRSPCAAGRAHDGAQLTVPARPENIDAVHDLIASLWAQRPGLPAEDRLRFETAVIEVANNIVKHATARLAGVPEVTIELTLTATADRLPRVSATMAAPPTSIWPDRGCPM